MTIAQQRFAAANTQLNDMSLAMEAVEDAEMVATRIWNIKQDNW